MTNPFQPLAVLDTNDALASSVLRTDTLSRCLRRFNLDSAETKLEINLISVVASDATFA